MPGRSRRVGASTRRSLQEEIEVARDHRGDCDDEHNQRDDQRAIDAPEVLLAPEVSPKEIRKTAPLRA
jgi:hypothetical protein